MHNLNFLDFSHFCHQFYHIYNEIRYSLANFVIFK